MKLNQRLLLVTIASALVVPCTVFAAKGDKKSDKASPPNFAACDKDKDGVVTKTEYLAAMTGRLGAEGAANQFALLDKNGDDKLSKEEFAGGGRGKGKGDDKKKKNRNN